MIFSDKVVEPTKIGRQQFFDYETYGTCPEKPDPFFLCLRQGKKWFNVQQDDLRKSWGTGEWFGFYCYWKDWKGQRWVLRHLFSWVPKELIPEWFYRED